MCAEGLIRKASPRKGYFIQGVKDEGKSARQMGHSGTAYAAQWQPGAQCQVFQEERGPSRLLGFSLVGGLSPQDLLALFIQASGISRRCGMARPCAADSSEELQSRVTT